MSVGDSEVTGRCSKYKGFMEVVEEEDDLFVLGIVFGDKEEEED